VEIFGPLMVANVKP